MPDSPPIRQLTEPDELLAWYRRHPQVHVYGLADLDERYWPSSQWFRRGDAVVGILVLPATEPLNVVYAVSVDEPSATIRLLLDLSPEIPDGSLATAPVGSVNWMRELRAVRSLGPHYKMSATDTAKLGPSAGVVPLGVEHLEELLDLYAQDPGAAFFLPSMLDGGLWAGVRHAGKLVAAGGTHVLSTTNNVAALGGILTHPEARGQGHASRVTSFLTRQLCADGLVVGLNVHADNLTARRLYQGLGFTPMHEYEEFEFLSS